MIAEEKDTRSMRRRGESPTIKLEGLPAIYSLESERSLIGAMISEPELVIDQALEKGLSARDFFNPANQILCQSLYDLRSTGRPIDPSTILQYLDDRKLTDSVGGPALLGELAAGVVSVLTAPSHIEAVKNKSLLRSLQEACAKIVYNIQERQHEPRVVLDEAESAVFGIVDESVSKSIVKAKDVVLDTLNLIIRTTEKRGKGAYEGLPSGFDALDQLTTGFKPGEMVVVAARPGVGKTAFALSVAKNLIKERYDDKLDRMVKPGHPVGVFSLEMTSQQLMLRLIASHASVSLQRIREGKLSEGDLTALSVVASEMSDLPIYIDESSFLSISQLRAKARRMKQTYKVEMIFIDYLQLLTSESEKARDSRQVEVAEISRGIKALAMELKIPIMVLAQLNRKPEETNSEPALHHLRESGSIEQDADVVMMLSRVENKDGEVEKIQHGATQAIKARLNVVKQRNGPTDKLDLLFQGEYTRFDSMPRQAK